MKQTQGLLFNPYNHELVAPPGGKKGLSIEERFEIFHRGNPHVYAVLVRVARRMKRSGKVKTWSMKAAFEVVRYRAIETYGQDWKLNNDYTSHYARLIMEREKELAGFFRTREDVVESG